MSDIAIKVENISKLYQLGEVGTGTISYDLNRWLARMRSKEDPYFKIGQTNDRTKKAESNFVWALQDLNFEVKQGEVLGIIGRNGAGKSTLLKILSKITTPTTGKIYTRGRIASLLEVGTGFHQEMTGRENIYLNGAIHGMRKWEIDKKFDEIVDFAGVEAYIDTPVKRYSSGMYVRLAFAVAAFLEPEILIVDEVLAVGDSEFQKKCLGRMKDVSEKDGRTVLFVSHNLGSVESLCSSTLLMNCGKLIFHGSQRQGISLYHKSIENEFAHNIEWDLISAPGDERARILRLSVSAPNMSHEINFSSGILLKALIKSNIENQVLDLSYNVKSERQELLFHHASFLRVQEQLKKGFYQVQIIIPPYILNQGRYFVDFWMGLGGVEMVGKRLENIIGFDVTPNSFDSISKQLPGLLRPKIEYRIDHNEV
jgi:lipopolysaccharide transport system ATP-binding protein